MATVLHDQTVRIAPRVVAFTVVCEECARLGESFPSVDGRLSLDRRHGTIECRHGHQLQVERAG